MDANVQTSQDQLMNGKEGMEVDENGPEEVVVVKEESGVVDVEHLLSNLHLRKIIKENHGAPLEGLAFNRAPMNQHMIATVGGGLVSIYDNNHCGGHLDLSCYYTNQQDQYSKGGLATDVEWIRSNDRFENDALLAFGCQSGQIGILSVGRTQVVELLNGHTGPILNMRAHPTLPGHLVTCSEDGTVRLWNTLAASKKSLENPMATCVAIWKPKATAHALAIHPNGSLLVLGCGKGGVVSCTMNVQDLAQRTTDATTPEADTEWKTIFAPTGNNARLDCISFVGSERVVVHHATGRLLVLSVASGEKLVSMMVPKGDVGKRGVRGASAKGQTRFGLSNCGKYICCGNPSGEVFIFNLENGKRINKLAMPRIKGFVTASAFSLDSKSVVLATDDSILWRWDYALINNEDDQNEQGNY